MLIMAEFELYDCLPGDSRTKDFALQTFPWKADLKRLEKPNEETELP